MVVASQAGFLASEPTLSSTHDQIYRSPGNLGQIATQSKTVTGPFSSQSRSDIRITNPGVYAHATPLAYAATASAPIYHQTAPAVYHQDAPAVYHHAPAPVAPLAKLLGVAYSPAVAVSHMSYSAPFVSYSY